MNKFYWLGVLFCWNLFINSSDAGRPSAFTKLVGSTWPPSRVDQCVTDHERPKFDAKSSTEASKRALIEIDAQGTEFHGISSTQKYCQTRKETEEVWKKLLTDAGYRQEEMSNFWLKKDRVSPLASAVFAPAAQAQPSAFTPAFLLKLLSDQTTGKPVDQSQKNVLLRRMAEIETICELIGKLKRREIDLGSVISGEIYLQREEFFNLHVSDNSYFENTDVPLNQINLIREYYDIDWCLECLSINEKHPVTTMLNPVIVTISETNNHEPQCLKSSVQVRSSLHRLRKIFQKVHENTQGVTTLKFSNKKELGLSRVQELSFLQKRDLELLDLELLRAMLIKHSDGIELRYSDGQLVTIFYDTQTKNFGYQVKK